MQNNNGSLAVLEQAETNIASLLKIAADALDILSRVNPDKLDSIEEQVTLFLNNVKEIYDALRTEIGTLTQSESTPVYSNNYTTKFETFLASRKIELIYSHLQELNSKLPKTN